VLTEKKIFAAAGAASAELANTAKYPYYFPVTPTTDQIEDALVGYTTKQGYKKLAFLAPDNASGHGAEASIKKAAANAGVQLSTAFMDPTLVDATAQMQQLKSSNPDALVLDGFGATVGVFLKTKSKLQWNIPTLADETFAAGDLAQFASASDLKGVKLQFFSFDIKGDPAAQTSAVQILQQSLLDAPKVTLPLWAPGLSVNSIFLAKMAGDKAGPTVNDGPTLTAALESFQEIPADLKDVFFGAPKLGFSTTNHAPLWGASDFVWPNAGPLDKLLLVPGS
jgi:ABC-type branched-subunit amino acid transport system substrate-binding protein